MSNKKLPTLSIVVMAHDSRAAWFPYLRAKLGDNVEFSIDDSQKKLGTWGNRRQAMQMLDKKADYGLIIQDDAVICDNFIEKARQFIAEHPHNAYQFFYGNRPSAEYVASSSITKHKGFITADMTYGVAIALPMRLIDEAISFCDQFPADMPDDSRIKRYCKHKNMQTVYPFPALVDHRVAPSLVPGNDKTMRRALAYIDRPSIPRTIHQIWVGPLQPPRYIKTWQNIDGWDHKLWDEAAIAGLNMKNQKLYNFYMDQKIYYGAADVARLEILEQYGGVYIDADTVRIKQWGDQWFLETEFFAVQANTAPQTHYRVANGIMGCVPGAALITEYIKRMGQAKEVLPCWSTIGGTMLTELVLDMVADPNIAILPSYTFYPRNSRGLRSEGYENAIARHVWGSTKGLYQ